MYSFTHTYDVTLSDIDQNFKIPINAVLGIYTDTCARQMASEGIGPADLLRMSMLWVITEFECRICGSMPMWNETFEVEVHVCELTSVRVYIDYTMKNCLGNVFAQGFGSWVIMDMDNRRPVGTNVLLPLGTLLDRDHFYVHEPHRILISGQANFSSEHVISVMDTDFNGHMNNQSYVKLAMSMAPMDFISNNSVSYFHIKFGRESFIGDSLVSSLYKEEGGRMSVVVSRKENSSEACRMTSLWIPNKHIQQ